MLYSWALPGDRAGEKGEGGGAKSELDREGERNGGKEERESRRKIIKSRWREGQNPECAEDGKRKKIEEVRMKKVRWMTEDCRSRPGREEKSEIKGKKVLGDYETGRGIRSCWKENSSRKQKWIDQAEKDGKYRSRMSFRRKVHTNRWESLKKN